MNFRESTTPLMRPDQIVANQKDIANLEKTLNAPPHLRNQIQDEGLMRNQLRGLKKMEEDQAPKAYSEDQLDDAKRRRVELEKSIVVGMPTAKEMRKNPPGAVGKNIAWEKAKKSECLELKNILKRLRVSGHLPDHLADGDDLCNMERYRSTGGGQEFNMHGAQIEGQSIHLNEGKSVVFTDEQLDELERIDPELRSMLGAASAEQRAGIKKYLQDMNDPDRKILCGADSAHGTCKMAVENEGDKCRHHKE